MTRKTQVLTGIIIVSLICIVYVLFHAPPAFAANGTISDSMCGRKHMMPNATDVECTEACVKAGASYVLVTENKIYTLEGDVSSVKPFAGKQVHVAGTVSGESLTVKSISGAN
jgi:hypothetical protein